MTETQPDPQQTSTLSDVEIRVIAVQASAQITAAEAGGRGSTGNAWERRAKDIERYIKTGL
jgi:hypothetical protein